MHLVTVVLALAVAPGDPPRGAVKKPDPADMVIPAGFEAVFKAAADPGPGGFPGGLVPEAIRVGPDAARIVFKAPDGGTAEVVLAHPGVPRKLPQVPTGRFAVWAGPGATGPLAKAVAERLKAAEGGFEWRRRLRLAATPIHPLNRATLAAGQGAQQDAACAALAPLVTRALDGKVAEALAEVPKPAKGEPRCLRLLRLKLAAAAGDAAAVDAAAKAALAGAPKDPDALFLWGTFYYDRRKLDRAVEIWDRLAAFDPGYPTFIGQYGTAWLVSGRLDAARVARLARRAAADPSDIVATYLAGLGLYYQKDYKAVIPHLKLVAGALPDEPRAAMYLAMAHFFAGDRDTAHRMMDALEPYAYQEPDINYCRSLIYRSSDLPRAIREMERFLEVFEGERRLRFGQQKVRKARSDLELMRKGEIPDVHVPPDPPEDPGD